MKKWLLGAALAVISAVAFALPSPHQIEDALASHDYDTAKSMTQEVLRERPDSAIWPLQVKNFRTCRIWTNVAT
jgi:hypothetical protein